MANYRAVATGNWSAGGTWGGGAVPPNGEAHNIYSNGFTVTIDTNVDVALITNAGITASFVGGGTSAAAGGIFSVSAATSSIVANITAGANITTGANLLSYGQASPSACTITGNLTGASNGNGAFGCNAVVFSGSGTLTINGNLRAGGTAGGSANAVSVTGGGTLVVNSSIISTQGSFATAAVSSAINLSGAGSVTLNNCQLNAATSYPAVNTTAGTVTAINCIFTASTAGAALSSTATGNRLSGTFISASNGMQPINAARWFLNTTPTNSYIQQALDGINANSYVRYYTADTALGQANPTDVRSGVSYASGALTGRLTVPARGSVALSVNYGPSMPFAATRSGTTATATLAYSYPLVAGDQITVTGASNSEWNSTYTIASIVSGTSVTFEVPASHSSTAGTGATMQTTGTAVLDPASIASAVQSALTSQGLTSARAGNLDNLDATVSSRLAPSGTLATVTTLTNAPASVTASDIWSYATRTTTGGTVDTLTNAPSVPSAATIASQVRTELSPELAKVSALNTTRLSQCTTTEILGNLLAQANS